MKISSVLGKYIGKSIYFLKRKETKTAWFITDWSVGTFFIAITIYSLLVFGSELSAFILFLIYSYGTYALYSTISSNS